jgi:AcrR family transcriptional regulator
MVTAAVGRLRSPEQRAERATRILDTAADLLLRHGYRRVSIDDVADGAGIGKGTVYLHWKTREQLFGAVFAREVLAATDALREALRRDPRTCLPHQFARTYFLAVVSRPLLRGFLVADPDLLGKLTSAPDTARDERHAAMARGYFALLAQHRLLCEDRGVDEIGYAYQAVFEGFLRAAGDSRDPEHHADLLAWTIRRALESGKAPTRSALREVAAGTVALLDELIATDSAEYGIPPAGA